MPRYRLSSGAESDLAEIADYTIETFGIEQARRRANGPEACFQGLAHDSLDSGSADEQAPGIRRFRYESHVIFYLPSADEVFVVRVLHKSMDFQRRL